MNDTASLIGQIASRLRSGAVIPYLGPGMLSLCSEVQIASTPLALAEYLTARASVPHKIRHRLTQAAQFIENFKHRKTVVKLMDDAFATSPAPSRLHLALAASKAPLLVDNWYDDTLLHALRQVRPAGDWGQVQGLSQSEHFGTWTAGYTADGALLDSLDTAALPPSWNTLLYKPLGGRSPASNYLVSDTDFVEVLTEIDIQTPIPLPVQALRSARSFLFVGCRFDDQLARNFARQIMKRSSSTHWAVLPGALTRMEQRFIAEQNIGRIDLPLTEFADRLCDALAAAATQTHPLTV
ncbi:MAG: SIR2 family protein [Thiomonas sp.]|jgi:hypothetical protein